jgi:hypothetical protein
MRISNIKIRNFRSIREVEFCPRSISTFIGKNSNGKSNILKAIEFFFRASASKASADDVCQFSDDAGTWVECTFTNLTAIEREKLGKYALMDGTARFRRTLIRDNQSAKTEVQGYIDHPTDDWLRSDFDRYSDKDFWQEREINVFDYADRPASGRITRAVHAEFCTNYIARHINTLNIEQVLSTTQATGRQSTFAGVLPQLIYVPAVGDIVPEIYGKKSSLMNIIVGNAIKAAQDSELYRDASSKLDEVQGFVNPSEHRLPSLSSIESSLEERLASWPGIRCSIKTEIGDLSDLIISGLKLSIHDGIDSDLGNKGDGIQRQVLFQVFRLYSDYKKRCGIFADEQDGEEESNSVIIIFEEPELFLHPQAQEQFYDDLIAVSETDQVFLATHSNHLLRLEFADSLYIVRRSGLNEPSVISGPSDRWADNGERAIAKEIDFFNSEIAKMFFADHIIITEGPEDVVYITAAARQSGVFSRTVSVVPAGGIQGIPRLQRILNALKVPYSIAHDNDPGNDVTQRTALEIASLAATAQQNGHICQVQVFNDTLPHEYFDGDLPEGGSKVEKALSLIQNTPASRAFCTRIRQLYSID